MMSEDVPSWQRGQKHREGESKMFDEYFVLKHMALFVSKHMALEKETRSQNRAMQAQQGGSFPLGRALASLGRRLERGGREWLPLKDKARPVG
jgi:hypothetical protein